MPIYREFAQIRAHAVKGVRRLRESGSGRLIPHLLLDRKGLQRSALNCQQRESFGTRDQLTRRTDQTARQKSDPAVCARDGGE